MAHEFLTWAFEGRQPPHPDDAEPILETPSLPGEVLRSVWNHLCRALNRAPTIEEIAIGCMTLHEGSNRVWRVSRFLQVSEPFCKVHSRHVETVEFDLVRRLKGQWLETKRDRLDYLAPLIELRRLHQEEPLKVFTLNYDLTVESLCEKLGVAWTDGFTNGNLSLNAVPVFHDIGRDIFAESPISVLVWKADRRKEKPQVELFKLHGSVNWFQQIRGVRSGPDVFETYRQIRHAMRGDPFGGTAPGGALAKLDAASTQVFFSSDAYPGGQTYLARLVFGSPVKYLPAVPFIRMYELLYRYLRRTRTCIVVGYSFGDEHVNAMIRDAFNRNGSWWTPHLNLVVIDPVLRPDLPDHLGLARAEGRIWTFVGPASTALADSRFHELVEDLQRRGRSAIPHLVHVGAGAL